MLCRGTVYLLWEPYGVHKHTLLTEWGILAIKAGGTYSNHRDLKG
jgi:hypothetical protein